MVPVIRIDDEVWKELQQRAEPLVDSPNDVLRRILKLDKTIPSEVQNDTVAKDSEYQEEARKAKDSIFIVINAAGKKPDEANAIAGKELTVQRVSSGVDIQAPRRFGIARRILEPGTRIVMHQGGAQIWRTKYGSGQLMAAGRVKAVGIPLTTEDQQGVDYKITPKYYPSKPLVGKAIYEFPDGLAKQPLPKEDVPYQVGRGNNFIEVKPNDRRYPILDVWWKANSGDD